MDSKAVITRRKAIGAALVGASPLLFPGRGEGATTRGCEPDDTFVLLLKGLYQPVTHGPNLGLKTVDLNDGSYSATKIYPVIGAPGHKNPKEAIGDFYAQSAGDLCAYNVPGGAFAMRFIQGAEHVVTVPDEFGSGSYLLGTWELEVIEGTRKYRSLVGGQNHMEDKLHFLASGDVDEYCFCFISGP